MRCGGSIRSRTLQVPEEWFMQCSIYALAELRKKLGVDKKGLCVLARYRGMLILLWDEKKSLWTLPDCTRVKGEDADATVRRMLSSVLGEATFEVGELCGYGVTGEDGKEKCGVAYIADVRDWPYEWTSKARAFARLPLSSQIADAALVDGLYRWAGNFFDERLDLARLAEIGPF